MRAACAGLLACVSLSLPACANSYAGIPFGSGTSDPALQALARRAQAGDKHAQLDLGIRYEEGRGLAVDIDRARRLYALAAADVPIRQQVYSPPVGRNGQGSVTSVRRGFMPGLAEARQRLGKLQANTAPAPRPASEFQSGASVPGRAATPLDPGGAIELERLVSTLDDQAVWNRLISEIETVRSKLDPVRVARIFGIKGSAVKAGKDTAVTVSALTDERKLFYFNYAMEPCLGNPTYSVRPCSSENLAILNVFTGIAGVDEGDLWGKRRADCVYNDTIVGRLRRSGWRRPAPPSADPAVAAHSAFDQLVKGTDLVVVRPSTLKVSYCVSAITLYRRQRVQ